MPLIIHNLCYKLSFNKVPNNSSTVYLTNNVCLTTMCTCVPSSYPFSTVVISDHAGKTDLREMKANNMKTKNVCADEIHFVQ